MRFVVRGYDASGKSLRLHVEAESAEDARDSSGLPASRIIGVKEDAVGLAISRLTSTRPKGELQAIFMASLGAILLSGQGLQKGIDRLLSRYEAKLRFDKKHVRQQTRTSDLLEVLRFDPVAVTLVRVGEKTGTVAESLAKAASNILYQLKLKEELSKALMSAWLYIGIGVFLTLATILGFGSVLKMIANEPGLELPNGEATRFIMDAHGFAQDNWVFIIIGISLIIWQRGNIWVRVRHLPVLNWFWSVGRLRNAIFFTSGFQTLFTAGVTEEKAFLLLRSGVSASTQPVYDAALAMLNEGNPLSRAIDTEDWPDTLREGLYGFESAPHETKKVILSNLIEVLMLQQRIVSKRVARLAFFCGISLAGTAIMLMVFGVFFPIQQIRAV